MSKNWMIVTITFFAALSVVNVCAQKPLIPRHDAGAAEYVLGEGDQITIHVEDVDEISERPMRVSPDGFIDLPLVGRVEAAGLTLSAMRDQLRSRFSKYVSDPKVSINLVENQSRFVSVVGSVNSPGMRNLTSPQHLIDVISLSGGATKDAGSRVIITRQARWGQLPLEDSSMDSTGTYSTASVSLDKLLSSANPDDNIFVDPGDVISIPKAEIIYVLGTVKKAGGFPLATKDSMSLLHTLSLAEGFDRDAAPGKARILRPSQTGEGQVKEIPVNISKIIKGEDPDIPLYANDILFVPNSLTKLTARRAAEAVLQVATGVLIYR